MAQAATAESPKPAKWVLSYDHGFHGLDRIQEFWRYRHLIRFFGGQAFEKLYRKTRLGLLWVPIRPLAPLLVGTIVYGGLMNLAAGARVPYFLLLTGASIAWNCFDGPWTWGSRGLELNRDLITKLYFPRMILPLATMTPGLVEPVVNIGVFAIALVYYRAHDGVWYVQAGPSLLLAPLVLAAILCLAFSLGLFTSLYQVRSRDIRFVIGYVVGFWMYVTPVIYPATYVAEQHRWLLWLNPMAPLVELFKGILFGSPWPPTWAIALSGVEIAAAFALSLWHFHRKEGDMADKI